MPRPRSHHLTSFQSLTASRRSRKSQARPVLAYRQRGGRSGMNAFNAPELWHESQESSELRIVVQPAGMDYTHAVTADEVRERLAALPADLMEGLEVVQFSRMSRKRALFPCYGMQWGCAIYLYPVEASLVETYVRPPRPEQLKEARMYGARWSQEGNIWKLHWTPETIRDFYLNNVLIHEVGHIHDRWNTSFQARERYANWFADEYGYRASRGRR